MDISSRSFSLEVTKPDGKKTEVSFTGKDALMAIAYAEVMTPQIKRLCDGYEQVDPNKRGFDEQLTGLAIAQATLKLSQEVSTDTELFSRGVLGLSALTETWDRMNQLTFKHLAGLNRQSPEFLRRQVQLQQQERQLAEHRELLDVFRQLQAK